MGSFSIVLHLAGKRYPSWTLKAEWESFLSFFTRRGLKGIFFKKQRKFLPKSRKIYLEMSVDSSISEASEKMSYS